VKLIAGIPVANRPAGQHIRSTLLFARAADKPSLKLDGAQEERPRLLLLGVRLVKQSRFESALSLALQIVGTVLCARRAPRSGPLESLPPGR
jgi:hypothetical protein